MESLSEKAFTNLAKNQKTVDKNAIEAQKIHLGPISFPDFGFFRSKDDKAAIELQQRFNQIMAELIKKIGDLELTAVRPAGG